MAIQNYSDLSAAVKDWLNRTDLTDANIATLIQLAERDMARNLRARCNEVQTTFTIDTTTTTYTLPASLVEIKELNNTLADAPPLERISLQDFKKFGSVAEGGAGWPVYFARDYTMLVFYPVTAANTLSLTYWRSPEPLTGVSTTNDILMAAPDLYLFGCLAAAELWLKVEEPRFGALYNQALADENGMAARAEYAGSTKTMGTPYG